MWYRFNSRPRNFHMPWMQPGKKKKKKSRTKAVAVPSPTQTQLVPNTQASEVTGIRPRRPRVSSYSSDFGHMTQHPWLLAVKWS